MPSAAARSSFSSRFAMSSNLSRGLCWSACLLLPFGVACGAAESATGTSELEALGSGHALLRVDAEALLAGDDVIRLRFEAQRVSCAGEDFAPATIVDEAPLADLLLPVENPSLAGQPLAPDSEHAFADELIALQAGCYDITLTPLGKGGEPSRGCRAASAHAVRILPELTTEIVLLSQCGGAEGGLADNVLAFNHAPSLDNPSYTRFVATCEKARICVSARDADRDPLELVWSLREGSDPRVTEPLVESSTIDADGRLEQCVSVVPQASALFDFEVTAYDRAQVDGQDTRIESLLGAAASAATSHASIAFSLLASGESCSP